MTGIDEVLRNFPWADAYTDRSFCGRFHEEGIWDDEEYFMLEDALYELGYQSVGQASLERSVAWPTMRIYSYLMMSLGCVRDPSDPFALKNVSGDQFIARRERLLLVFEGFFRGEMPDRETLEY